MNKINNANHEAIKQKLSFYFNVVLCLADTYSFPFGNEGLSNVMLILSLGSCLTEVILGALPGTPVRHMIR